MPSNTKVSTSGSSSPNTSCHNDTSTVITPNLTTRGDSPYNTGDCRSCIITGNKVSLLVKTYSGKYTDGYMWIDDRQYVVVEHCIADPDSPQVLFIWKNLTTIKDGFAFMLQNDWGAIGVENFKNEEPLSVQLQGNNNKNHYYMYKHGSGEYFSLHLKSPDGHFYYILPKNETLRIYRQDALKKDTTLRHQDLYVFRIGSYKCSNVNGPCPFERMMRKNKY